MRITVDIMEATTLISACDLKEESLHIALKDARKKNDSTRRSELGMELAEINLVRRKLKDALASATQSGAISE